MCTVFLYLLLFPYKQKRNLDRFYYGIFLAYTISVFCFCQDAPHFTIDKKLKDILKATPGACLQYAVIEGNQCFSYRLFGSIFVHLKIGVPLFNLLSDMCTVHVYFVGATQPVGEPLRSHFQKEIIGVLQKFMLREHRLVWNNLSSSW